MSEENKQFALQKVYMKGIIDFKRAVDTGRF